MVKTQILSFLVRFEVPDDAGVSIMLQDALGANVVRVSEHFGGLGTDPVTMVQLLPEHRVKQILDVIKATEKGT